MFETITAHRRRDTPWGNSWIMSPLTTIEGLRDQPSPYKTRCGCRALRQLSANMARATGWELAEAEMLMLDQRAIWIVGGARVPGSGEVAAAKMPGPEESLPN